jgi:hypothetical protein
VDGQPSNPNHHAVRLTQQQDKRRKPYEELGIKQRRKLLRAGMSAASAATGLSFFDFFVECIDELEEVRRHIAGLFDRLPDDVQHIWSLRKEHQLALPAEEVAELRDVGHFSEFQVCMH